MVKYIETLRIPKNVSNRIEYLLNHEPTSADECLGEDETIRYTVRFYKTSMEMDIKLCGVQYEEGSSNLPWAEAVLFNNGLEVAFSEPQDGYFGKWDFEYKGIVYECNVVKER